MASYEVEGLKFDSDDFEAEADYCRACGECLITFKAEWLVGSEDGQKEYLISVTAEGGLAGGFVAVAGKAYRVCDECLRLLQRDGEEDPIIIKLLHPKLQKLLSSIQDINIDEEDRTDIETVGRLKALINLACKDDC